METLRPAGPIEEIAIDDIRRDATLVTRGGLLVGLLPAIPAFQMVVEAMRDFSQNGWEKLQSPLLWGLLIASLGGLWYLRRFGGSLCMNCLRSLIAMQALLLAALALGLAVFIGYLAAAGAKRETVWVLAAVLVILLVPITFIAWWAILSPMQAARRLLATRLPPHGLTLPAAFEQLAALTPAASPLQERPVPPAARACQVAAWGIGLASAALVVMLFAYGMALVALAFEFVAIYAVILLVRRAKQLQAVDADERLRSDLRPPVLYLRSFQDDAELFESESDIVIQWRARSGGDWKPTSGRKRKLATSWIATSGGRMEEALASLLGPIGPLVAIGKPDEPLPELGAARAYFSNDTWQRAIQRWVDMSCLIVKVAGPTAWIRWELDTIIRQGALHKLIVLMPPGRPEDEPQRWANVSTELADTPWGASMVHLNAARIIAIRFLEGGRLAVITSNRRRYIDYTLAFRILLHQVTAERGP